MYTYKETGTKKQRIIPRRQQSGWLERVAKHELGRINKKEAAGRKFHRLVISEAIAPVCKDWAPLGAEMPRI